MEGKTNFSRGLKQFDGLTWLTPDTLHPLLCLHPHRVEALSDAFVWCLSVAYIGPNLRAERPRKSKIDTEVAQVTHDSDPLSRSKVNLLLMS